jgi:hypothetical protein
MKCRYCKEEIESDARKCPKCGEVLKGLGRLNFNLKLFATIFSLLIPFITTSIAILEHIDKLRVEKAKAEAVAENQATNEVLDSIVERIPKERIEEAAADSMQMAPTDIRSKINLIRTNPETALMDFKSKVKVDPDNMDARKGIIYSKILAEKKR